MSKYIDADKVLAEIERRLKIVEPHKDTFESAAACRQELIWMKDFIISLQQEQPKDKQIIIISESHGDANIEWDCRSLDDVIALLKSAESFITEKQVEELRGHGSEPDYNTTEGRFRNAHKFQQEQPDVDLEKEYERFVTSDPVYSKLTNGIVGKAIARHFYELGLNARKEE